MNNFNVLIPIHENRISPFLDTSREFVLLCFRESSYAGRIYLNLYGETASLLTGTLNLTHVVCDELSSAAEDAIREQSITVIKNCRGALETVAERIGNGEIESLNKMQQDNDQRGDRMKVAITTQGQTIDAGTDPRFGRAAGFIIYDLETDEFVYKDNSVNLESAQGAGIQTAKNIIDSGAQTVITGNVGPKAFTTLQAAGVEIFLCSEPTVKEAIAAYKKGALANTESANVEGHW